MLLHRSRVYLQNPNQNYPMNIHRQTQMTSDVTSRKNDTAISAVWKKKKKKNLRYTKFLQSLKAHKFATNSKNTVFLVINVLMCPLSTVI